MEIFADKPARVSRSMDTLQTCGIAPKVLKCIGLFWDPPQGERLLIIDEGDQPKMVTIIHLSPGSIQTVVHTFHTCLG